MACEGTRVGPDWLCAACGFVPASIGGFPAFAPALALENDGMDPASHDALDAIQDQNFWFRARNRLIGDPVRRHARGAARVLELGCGTGYVTQALRTALPQAAITASEIYASGLAHAVRRVPGPVEFLQLDARQIPFRAEFDLVCAFDVLEHIEHDAEVLERIAAALAPGGVVVLSVPQHPALWSEIDVYSRHKRRYRRRELAGKCRAAEIAVVTQTSFVTALLPAMLAKRRADRRRLLADPAAEHRLSRPVDRALELVLGLERRLIGAGLRLPVGGSRFVVGQVSAARR